MVAEYNSTDEQSIEFLGADKVVHPFTFTALKIPGADEVLFATRDQGALVGAGFSIEEVQLAQDIIERYPQALANIDFGDYAELDTLNKQIEQLSPGLLTLNPDGLTLIRPQTKRSNEEPINSSQQHQQQHQPLRKDNAMNENETQKASPKKLEWTNLTIKGAFVEPHENKTTGVPFYEVRIPPNTLVAGAIDVGNYRFTVSENRVHDSKFDTNALVIGLIKDKPLVLTKSLKQDDGTYKTTKREVMPENLRVAINTQYKEYKATKNAERAQRKSEDAPTPATDRATATKSAKARTKTTPGAPAKQQTR